MTPPDLHELEAVLAAHAQKYPLMRPCDAVKLVFQNEWGGGHLISDAGASLRRLQDECAQTPHDGAALPFEDIGNGLVRVMLPALDAGRYPFEALNRDFVRSAQLHTGSRDSFACKLWLLQTLARQGLFRFSAAELDQYLAEYRQAGCPPVSHSGEYRAAYRPAYRVVLRSLVPAAACDLPALVRARLTGRPDASRPLLIAIDGRCASGKTTLAARLREICGCTVAHMDHFFLRPEQRTEKRYQTPGGNVDHERFLQEVLLPLHGGAWPEYRPFDCHTQRLAEPVCLERAPAVVVEGSYSCHPALRAFYDLRIFLTISPEEQLRRIAEREGADYAEVFRTRWIPLEERYFSACRPELYCELSFDTSCGLPL